MKTSSKELLLDSLLVIGRGLKRDLSLMEVKQQQQQSGGSRLFSFLNIGWGFIADVDIESERYRWECASSGTGGCVCVCERRTIRRVVEENRLKRTCARARVWSSSFLHQRTHVIKAYFLRSFCRQSLKWRKLDKKQVLTIKFTSRICFLIVFR